MARPWFKDRKGIRVSVASGAATVELVAAATGKKYRLLRAKLTNITGAATLQFKSATTAITGIYHLPVNDDFEYKWVGGEDCVVGEALNLVITGATADVDGDVWYEECQD